MLFPMHLSCTPAYMCNSANPLHLKAAHQYTTCRDLNVLDMWLADEGSIKGKGGGLPWLRPRGSYVAALALLGLDKAVVVSSTPAIFIMPLAAHGRQVSALKPVSLKVRSPVADMHVWLGTDAAAVSLSGPACLAAVFFTSTYCWGHYSSADCQLAFCFHF